MGDCDDGDFCIVGDFCDKKLCIVGKDIKDSDGDSVVDKVCGGIDCNDSDKVIGFIVKEICDDNVDNDCNGKIDVDDFVCIVLLDGFIECIFYVDCYLEGVCVFWEIMGKMVCSSVCVGL